MQKSEEGYLVNGIYYYPDGIHKVFGRVSVGLVLPRGVATLLACQASPDPRRIARLTVVTTASGAKISRSGSCCVVTKRTRQRSNRINLKASYALCLAPAFQQVSVVPGLSLGGSARDLGAALDWFQLFG